ncbi:MAG: arginine biosynthesis bifunctional protein ArgJ [Phycisphaerae bacterium]
MKNDTITAPKGFRAGTAACGIKTSGGLDVGILAAEVPCHAAAVFTRNRFCGAPVTVGREHVRGGKLRGIVVNSGCSNVATGKRGIEDAREMCRLAGEGLGAPVKQVLPASTGIIGQFLPMEKVRRGITAALTALDSGPRAGRQFATAILTTDLKVKEACERVRIGRQTVTVAGCCKGSGMIAPNMATMFAFITTDAALPAPLLRTLLGTVANGTFNRVTVDECQSTSDTVALLASGLAAKVPMNESGKFAAALWNVCDSLAYQLAADGEGATRVVEVSVEGAKTPADAHAVARAIAVSPLVKTAVHGGDPNWGRIVQAIGATDAAFNPERVRVWLNKALLFAKGAPAPGLKPAALSRLMRQKHVPIRVHLGAGKASDRVLTCDLSREYITINADYHT